MQPQRHFQTLVVAGMLLPWLWIGGAVRAQSASPNLNIAKIAKTVGSKGVWNSKAEVFTLMLPRSDLHVVVDGIKMSPPMGLTCWAAFQRAGKKVMVMGDQVLTSGQVNTVMRTALNNGLQVTALHNHYMWSKPRLWFMHIGGMGSETAMATAVGNLFAAIRATEKAKNRGPSTAGIDPAHSTVSIVALNSILRTKGLALPHGMYKAVFGMTTRMDGYKMGAAMGVNTWALFAGTDAKAVVEGDFVMTGWQVQAVLKSLCHAGIHIVAIHNHMIGEHPRVIFLHYWGVGPAGQLARDVRAALEIQHRVVRK